MITSLSIGNFKAFGDTQNIPIRPLTLIFGPNSAGKSTLIHSLLLAQHAMETNELDIHTTQIGGDSVDLGGFMQYVHRRDLRRDVEWSAEIDISNVIDSQSLLLVTAHKVAVNLRIGIGLDDKNKPITGINPAIQAYEISLDGKSLMKASRRIDGLLKIDRLELGHEILDEVISLEIITLAKTVKKDSNSIYEEITNFTNSVIVDAVITGNKFLPDQLYLSEDYVKQDTGTSVFEPASSENFSHIALPVNRLRKLKKGAIKINLELDISGLTTTEAIESLAQFIEAAYRKGQKAVLVTARHDNVLKTKICEWFRSSETMVSEFASAPKEMGGNDAYVVFLKEADSITSLLRDYMYRLINELIKGVHSLLSSELQRICYLGPLRSYPPRQILFTQYHDNNWIAGGGHAWDIIRRDSDIRAKVNEWLGQHKLDTPYELTVRNLVAIDDFNDKCLDVIESLDKSFANHEDNTNLDIFRDMYARLASLIPAKNEFTNVQELKLIDKRGNVPVSHRDVGIGISQVLPVLVNAFASKERIIAIEQPEIHLHPAMQAEIADILIESALGEQKNKFIIETHSEHLILRILRRIRETASGESEDSLFPISPQDVQVVYARPTGEGTVLYNLPVTEDGDFAEKWPDGFFPERARELF